MVAAGKKPKPLWLGAVFVVIGLGILIALGVWQLQRLQWKEGLLAHVAALQKAQPVDLSSVLSKPAKQLDFTRVRLNCPAVETAPALRLYALEDGQTGVRLIAACRVAPNRSILVDRGFLPDGAVQSAGRADLTEPVVGVLRLPPGRNFVTPPNNAKSNLWYWRDIPAMTRALCADKPMAVTLMLESPAAAPPGPRPAAIPTEIPNRHFEYALTWFGLAAALAWVYAALLWRRRST